MRINQENKTMDMESRDINYILPAYVRSYLFYSKNEMPERIIFPMFPSVRVGGIDIPIEYVPPLDVIAIDIAQDGSIVAEVTPAQEATIDEKDEEIKRLKEELAIYNARYTTPIPSEKVSPAKAAFAKPSRQPKQPPGGDVGPGLGLSDMHSRDHRDQARTAKDLAEEPDIEGAAEKEFEKKISRDKQGRPVVEG